MPCSNIQVELRKFLAGSSVNFDSVIMPFLPIVGLGLWIVVWTVGLLGRHVASKRYRRSPSYAPLNTSGPSESSSEGVTILRPCRGLDVNLYENLESSFRQEHPQFQIIFSVAAPGDAAIPIIESLMQKYPSVDARLIVGEDIVGVNPKVNNLVRAYAAATYDLLWVLDSNAVTTSSTLSRMLSALHSPEFGAHKRAIGMVHHVPFPLFPDASWGSRVEHAFLATEHAKMYLAINQCQVDSCIVGKSNLYRKSDLERLPSLKAHQSGRALEAFGDYLGEDNMIGTKLWHELGLRHAMNEDVVGNTIGNMSLQSYFWRRVRWIRVRKYMVFSSTLIEPFTESLLIGFIASRCITSFFPSIPSWLFFSLHMLAWYLTDLSVFRSLASAAPIVREPQSAYEQPGSVAFFQAWLLRECSALPIWLFAMAGNTVEWRDQGQRYQVRRDGTVANAPPMSNASAATLG